MLHLLQYMVIDPKRWAVFLNLIKKFPINLYAKSKADFDDYLLNTDIKSATIFGLRYFNVFGPGRPQKKYVLTNYAFL